MVIFGKKAVPTIFPCLLQQNHTKYQKWNKCFYTALLRYTFEENMVKSEGVV